MPSKDLTVRLLGDISDLQKKMNQAGNDVSRVGAKMTKAVTPAAAAIGVAMTVIGNSWNDAVDAIITGTGKSGDALDGLVASAKSVAGKVPNDFGQVGTAIAEVHTRLGLTGPQLEDTTKRFLDLSRITGTDVKTNIGLVSRVFGDWSIATEDQAAKLDLLYAASQTTGIGVDQLSTLVVQFGAPMRQLGFSLEESVALFGKFEKEGVNIETVMSGLRQGLGRMAKAGEEPIETFGRLVEQIKAAGTTGEANAISLDAFGQRAGPDMAAAIREGRFELDDLIASLGSSEGALDDAAERTVHLSDRLAMLRNKLVGAVGPFGEIGGAAAGAVASLGPLIFGLGQMGPLLGKVGAAFTALKAVMIAHPLLTIAAVVGAAVAAFKLFGQGVDDSVTSVDNLAQSMRDAESPLEGLVDTVNKMATDNELLRDVLDKAGVSTLDLAKAAQAGGEEWDRMRDRLDRTALSMDGGVTVVKGLNVAIGDLSKNTAKARVENDQLARVVNDSNDIFETARKQQNDYVAGLAADAAAAKTATEATEDGTDAIDRFTQQGKEYVRGLYEAGRANRQLKTDTGATEEALRGLIDAINSALGTTFSYEEGTIRLSQAVGELADKTGDDLRLAQIGAAEEALALSETFADQQGAIAGTTEYARLQKEELERLRAKFPELSDDIDRYITTLLRVPTDITTAFHVTGQQVTKGGDIIGMRTGKRAAGGPTQAGRTYEVTEQGSELLHEGGRTYLMAGANGQVEPLDGRAMSGAGGGDTFVTRIDGNVYGVEHLHQVLDERDRRLAARLGQGRRG